MDIFKHLSSFGTEMIVAAQAALKAGEVIRKGYGKNHQITEKGIGDLVSEVDRAADELIVNHLRQNFPQDEIVSEELNPSGGDGAERRWIVDPLDGTAAFLFQAGERVCSVLIALRNAGETELGVCYFPLSEEWFYAVRGGGVYRNGCRLALDMSNFASSLKEAWVEMNHYGDSAFETQKFALLRQRLRSKGGARLVTHSIPGSGFELRMIEGSSRISAIIHDNNPAKLKVGPWDTAAVQLMFEEAGGAVLNSKGERHNPFETDLIIFAASVGLAWQILANL